jgi:hypothetical protein
VVPLRRAVDDRRKVGPVAEAVKRKGGVSPSNAGQ